MPPEDELRQQIVELSARVAALEAALGSRPRPSAEPAAVPAPPLAHPTVTLETRIGGQLLNRLGILAVLIGVAWFLKLAFDRDWINPPIRVGIGLLCAAGLMAWSGSFRHRGFFAFSYSMQALATSIAYLSLWAASSLFHLAPPWAIFCAMTVVTVINAALARRQESEVLALYALAGGLATPGLLAMGHSNELFLFCYLALLNLGALLLLALHPWKGMAWAALVGTYFYCFVMVFVGNWPGTAFFLMLYFAGFSAASFLVLRAGRKADNFFTVGFPSTNAAACWVALMVLFGAPSTGRPWVTIALSGGCLVLAILWRNPILLSQTNLGLSILFLTVAVRLEFHGPAATLCWLLEALALVILAKAQGVLRIFATLVLMVAALSLLVDWTLGTPRSLAVVMNTHFATSLIGAAVFAAIAVLSLANQDGRAFGSWNFLAGFAAVGFSVTLLVAVSLEIRHYWFCGAGFFADFCYGYGQVEQRTVAAGWSYSAWWMLYGAGLMTVGFLRRSAFLRWQALAVLAFSIGKVFLNGVSQQSQGYRVLSFLALGVVLLAISFAYQKDWLRLRG